MLAETTEKNIEDLKMLVIDRLKTENCVRVEKAIGISQESLYRIRKYQEKLSITRAIELGKYFGI